MYEQLIKATEDIIEKRNFSSFTEFKIEQGKKKGFEVYWNILLKNHIKGVDFFHKIPNHEKRIFDLAWNQNGQWSVCEFGHEKSSQGYLRKNNGKIHNMGLINKWFFDYCRNYFQPVTTLNPKSYAYLYFSLDDKTNVEKLDEMYCLIKSVLPKNHQSEIIEVNKDGNLCGKIMIIDAFENFGQIREMYIQNKNIQKYVSDFEDDYITINRVKYIRRWYKHDLLTNNPNPPFDIINR
jgi:hypothetical protein